MKYTKNKLLCIYICIIIIIFIINYFKFFLITIPILVLVGLYLYLTPKKRRDEMVYSRFPMKYLKNLLLCIYFCSIIIIFIINYFDYCTGYLSTFPVLALLGLSLSLIPKKTRDEMESGDMMMEIFCIMIPMVMLIIDMLICSKLDKKYLNDGPSIVKKCKVTKVYLTHSNHLYIWKTDFVAMINNDTIKKGTITFQSKKVGNNILCYWNLDCPTNVDIEYYMVKNYTDFELINDFGFIENENLYSYHDYSLKKPDLVYYNVGFNILHKSYSKIINDTTAYLYFTQLDNTEKYLSLNIKNYKEIPDTFLVYKNINDKFGDKWRVCAPEVNTPENRAKISDYGYIFHYDVYSKEEIESQCPQIKNYVEQYKKRMAEK
ncbi:MAG: hypothetical protein PUC50_15700 [Bacteroidales bacterium]|nr:hypothetical protein [Bacteroidales bacterium]